MDVGPVELLIVLAVVLLLFGSKKLPELAKGMGSAAKEFRSGLNGHDSEPEAKVAEPTVVASSAADGVGTQAVDATATDAKATDTTATDTTAIDTIAIDAASGPTT
jgi:sec-independent protein translocase protein TatA